MSTAPAPGRAKAARDLVGTEVGTMVPPTSDTENQLAEYARWLAEHRDDPQLVAGCARLGRLLGGAA